MGILRKLFGKSQIQPEEAGEGPLFGLSPPQGCHFDVSNYEGSSWHVRIVRDDFSEIVAHECELIDWTGRGRALTDEQAIVSAAKSALAVAERKARIPKLEGCYPPLVVKSGQAAAQ
jgi:hypothetical protein